MIKILDIYPNVVYTFSIHYIILMANHSKGWDSKAKGTKGLQGCFPCQPVATKGMIDKAS